MPKSPKESEMGFITGFAVGCVVVMGMFWVRNSGGGITFACPPPPKYGLKLVHNSKIEAPSINAILDLLEEMQREGTDKQMDEFDVCMQSLEAILANLEWMQQVMYATCNQITQLEVKDGS